MSTVLETKDVSVKFGELYAVKNFSFKVKEGEILGLIGPNGAGKSTLFNSICGICRAAEGRIEYKGTDITGWPSYNICHLGIGRTFQIPLPFMELTGLENVMVSVLYGKKNHPDAEEARKEAARCIEFVGLEEKQDVQPNSYTIVDLKRLELARALGSKPQLLMLDEVMAGLNPNETTEAMQLIKRLQSELGLTVLWVEHVMKAVMGVVDRVVVIDHGMKLAEGLPKEVCMNKDVIDAYLGEKYEF
jgi:branched-chain amino acid transport system ATP-binding protein